MATQPIFADKPETRRVQCTAAYTDRTGATAGLADLVTGAVNGTKVTQIVVKGSGNTASCLVMIFITDNTGSSPRLFDEIALAASAPNTTVACAKTVVNYDDLQLKANQKIQVAVTALSSTIPVNVIAQIGDF